MEEEFHAEYVSETGLIACKISDQSIELTIEDVQEINDIVDGVGKANISKILRLVIK